MTEQKQREAKAREFLKGDLHRIRRFAYALAGSKPDAEDLVQNLAIRLLRMGIPDMPDPLPWAFRVCRNLWIDEVRARAARHNVSIEDCDDSMLPRDDQSMKTDAVIDAERVLKAMKELPEGQRTALSLVSVEGLSYAEAGQVMEVPIGTVMSRVARARENLLNILKTGQKGLQNER